MIDPAVHEPPIMKRWRELKAANSKLQLIGVLTTHKHYDHSKGNHAMQQSFPNIKIYGGKVDNIHSYLKENAFTHELVEGNTIAFGKSLITIFDVPCHTRGHILYYVTADDGKSHPSVFTGDTLFIGGVGHFFEGTPEQMQQNFDKMKAFPLETKVYCGHEYTQSNYEFCRMIEPKNEKLEEQYLWVKEKYLKSDSVCVPSTIKNEIATNVFMRTDVQTVRDNLVRMWNEAKKSGLVQLPNAQKFEFSSFVFEFINICVIDIVVRMEISWVHCVC